jgi:hypothetical protein
VDGCGNPACKGQPQGGAPQAPDAQEGDIWIEGCPGYGKKIRFQVTIGNGTLHMRKLKAKPKGKGAKVTRPKKR